MSNDQRLAHYAALESEARNDLPYTWGQTITTAKPGPFTVRQLARLMVMRSKLDLVILNRRLDNALGVQS